MNIILILGLSFIALLWGANHLVSGAAGLASNLKISPLTAGLTIVALGTSIPEISIALFSALTNENNLSVGNAIGSNIANIGLVLGITIIIKPGVLSYATLKKTYPILVVTMLIAYSMILDGYLGKTDGCILIITCIAIIYGFIYHSNHAPRREPFFNPFQEAIHISRSFKVNLVSIFLGLIILPISAKYIVYSATSLASWLGMNELAIGLTIIAFGTSLPELATSITAALQGEDNIAIGTILGSNIYNMLLIMAFPSLINPSKVSNIILWRDMPVLLALTLLLLFLNYHYKKKLSPWHGGILILIYISYIASLFLKI